jgi:Arc/MetJ-type ribon-helix-helix transcriptional regulator
VSPKKLEISLPDDLAAEVASAVARGEFTSESDAVLGAVVEWRVQRLAETNGVEELRRLCRRLGANGSTSRLECAAWSVDRI